MPKLKYLSRSPLRLEDFENFEEAAKRDEEHLEQIGNMFPNLKVETCGSISIAMPVDENKIWEIDCVKTDQFSIRQDFAAQIIAMDKYFDEMAELGTLDHFPDHIPEFPQNVH